jgi:hypothetical protein
MQDESDPKPTGSGCLYNVLACYGVNIIVDWLSSMAAFLGRPRFCTVKLRLVSLSSERMNSVVPRGRPV